MSTYLGKKSAFELQFKRHRKMFKSLHKNKIAISFYNINDFYSSRFSKVIVISPTIKGKNNGFTKNV